MKKISVIIVTYNSEKHIYDCLESIAINNDIGDDLEIIVVDNCSKDFDIMKTVIHEKYPDVLILSNTQNGGYGQGNNIGIRSANAPYIMIMNPDVRLTEPIFEKVFNYFEKKQNCVMYGMQQEIPGYDKLGLSFGWTFRSNIYIGSVMLFILKRLNIYWQKYMYFTGSCFFVRKSSFEDIGMFDENIFMYSEEDDIHGRLMTLSGVEIKYDKKLKYSHLHIPEYDSLAGYEKILKRDLDSKLYWNKRDGFTKKYTINKCIQIANTFLIREQLRSFFKKTNREYISLMLKWKGYLSDTL